MKLLIILKNAAVVKAGERQRPRPGRGGPGSAPFALPAAIGLRVEWQTHGWLFLMRADVLCSG